MGISNKSLFIILCVLATFSFMGGIVLSYQLGVYTAGSQICHPLSLGERLEGGYTCFNETYNSEPNYYFNQEVGDYS